MSLQDHGLNVLDSIGNSQVYQLKMVSSLFSSESILVLILSTVEKIGITKSRDQPSVIELWTLKITIIMHF